MLSFLCLKFILINDHKLQFIGGMRASGGKLFGKKLGKNFQEFWVLTRVR